MSLEFTELAELSSQLTNIHTNLVLEIDGVTDIFGSIDIKKYVRVGDPGLVIGDEWRIGGVAVDPNSKAFINYDKGTSKRITQSLRPDKVEGNQTTQMVLSLTDINEQASLLASRGGIVDDLLGRRVCLWLGFEDTGFKEDYIPSIRGRIQRITSGPTFVSLHIKNTEESKRRTIFKARTTELFGSIPDTAIATLFVDSSFIFSDPSTAGRVNGDPETQLQFLAKVDNEYFHYTAKSLGQLTVAQRGILTTAVAHDNDAPVQTAYRFTGPMIEITLRIMLSGWNGPHNTGVEVENINVIDNDNTVQNALLFRGIDVNHEYGIAPGSYVTLSGSASNDFTNRVVVDVVRTQTDSYIIVDGADLTDEIGTAGVCAFRSQYDTFGQGLRMHPNEVDILEHQNLLDTFLSTFEIDIIVDEIANAKAFLDEQLYGVFACYSIIRKGRSSVGFQSSPIPGTRLYELNLDTVLNPEKLTIERDITKYFYNSVDIQYEKNYDTGNFDNKDFFESVDSKAQIIETDAPLVIKAEGLRVALNGINNALRTAARYLARYQFGAEYIRNIEVIPKEGFTMEIGDIVLLNMSALKLTDYNSGTRSGDVKIFEIIDKQYSQDKASTTITVLNTAFSTDARYGRIAPSSFVAAGSSTTKLNLKKSYGTKFYEREYTKWREYIGQTIRVRSADYSQVDEVTLTGAVDNALTVTPALAFTPGEDFIITAPFYNTDTDPNTFAFWKAKHAYLGKKILVASYISQTQFTVAAGDIQYFQVDQPIQIINEDYTNVGPETTITDITGTTITMADATGFVFDATYIVRYTSFPDGGLSYRYV